MLLPVIDGEVTILPDHEPYIGALEAGEVIIRLMGQRKTWLSQVVLLNLIRTRFQFWLILPSGPKRSISNEPKQRVLELKDLDTIRFRWEKRSMRASQPQSKQAARIRSRARHRGRAPLSVIEGENE